MVLYNTPLYTMRKHIRKSHNVTMLLYHIVFPVKYRKFIFTTPRITKWLCECCAQLEKYEIYFDAIGVDWNHVHFLVQSAPTKSVTQIVTIIKSFTWKELLKYKLELSWKLWWKKSANIVILCKHSWSSSLTANNQKLCGESMIWN